MSKNFNINRDSRDFDQGARDGNQDLPPAKLNNPDYMEGYEEGLGLADAGVPYFSLYQENDWKRSHPDYFPLVISINKQLYEQLKAAFKSENFQGDFSDWVEEKIRERLE